MKSQGMAVRHRSGGQRGRDAAACDGLQVPADGADPDMLLARLVSVLNNEGPLDEVLAMALPVAAAASGVATAAVFSARQEPRARLLSVTGPTRRRGFPYADLALDEPLVAQALADGAAWRAFRPRAHELPQSLRDVCPRGAGVVVVVPARWANTLHGVVVMAGRGGDGPSPSGLALARAVADCLGMALANASLSQRSLLREAVLDTAGSVARAVSGTLDLTETFNQVAASAAGVLGDCRCLLLELDGASQDLVVVAASEADDESLLGTRIRFEEQAHAGLAVGDGRGFVVQDLVWGARTPEAVRRRLSVRSGLFVPIQSESGPIGSLLLLSSGRRVSYSAADVGIAGSLAEQAASAICNARLYRDLERSELHAQMLLRRITDLRGRQRMALAGAIHDDILQTVVAASFELQSLLGEASEADTSSLTRASDLLRETIDRARLMIRDLRPPVLDGLGLVGALQALVGQTAPDESPVLRLTVERSAEVDALSPAVSTAIYVVAREAVRNALRHASAGAIDVRLGVTDGGASGEPEVRLEVSDDGVGLDPGDAGRDDHFGLRMMEEQMAMIGGTLTLTSRDGTGTDVVAAVAAGGDR
jgi:signal transduction histidine kinase